MRYLTFALVACASLAVTPVFAQQSDQGAPLDRDNLHTIICQGYPPETGTRIGSRMICLTNLQWQEVHRMAREGYALEVRKSFTMGHNI